MSLNIGSDNSKYIAVKNPTMKLAYSDKVIFADLVTSRKTGEQKADKEGNLVFDEQGEPVPKRKYFNWEGRFAGNAFEAARGFGKFQLIDINTGWIEIETFKTKDGKNQTKYFVVITDFSLSSVGIESDADFENEDGEGEYGQFI